MKTIILTLLLCLFCNHLPAQNKLMTPEVYEIWNKIEEPQLSNKGNWITYTITNEKAESTLHIYNSRTQESFSFERSQAAKIDVSEKFVAFSVSANVDTIKAMKRRKVKKPKMPKDTLCIFNLSNKQIERIPNVISYKTSNDYPGCIAFKLAKKTIKQDSTLVKDEGKENGTKLIIKNVETNKSKALLFIKEYVWSDKTGSLVMHSTGEDSIRKDRILIYDATRHDIKSLHSENGEYKHFVFNKAGKQLAFVANKDTSDQKSEAHEIMISDLEKGKTKVVVSRASAFLQNGWQVSENEKPYFLENFNKLIFGTAPILAKPDTTLLDEEIVNVEVWHYEDGLLHTQQESSIKKEVKRSYKAVYDLETNQAIQLADESCPNLRLTENSKSKYLIGTDSKQYQKYLSWEGREYHDVYLVNIESGEKKLLNEKVASRPRIAPSGEFATWYSRSDTSWYSQNMGTGESMKLTSGTHYDELNDRPMHPWPSGTLSWSDNNESILYDHYDIWKIDITGEHPPQRLTQGRENNVRYRYIKLDKEIEVLPTDTTILVSLFNFNSKVSGFANLNLDSGELRVLDSGPYEYDNTVIKAKESDDLLFTKESFELFPDLILSNTRMTNQRTISNANPQQKDYGWGSIEMYDWIDVDGISRKALLAKPPNFNPNKKYPLIVNFYEKSSNGLYRHRAPYAHRSTINYTYYTNRGYVVFNPDIYYKDGYPGESCYDAVMSSVDQLLAEGFIDEENMGLQGHSWGGYQIAYLLTKTHRFKCAESGAPVVNMISAYGGIRWGSGMSRMFQYEKTQSRLGATLWERPDLYIYNSPVFQLDKVETPVLILHNDKDGAVPWYQGIEYFVGLRRLGKPAWMLNYNDEPHWPVKKQNRLDFNKRMEQFFDYYLAGGKLPVWMKDGIPVIKKGVDDGFGTDAIKRD